jgi:hypothetical protein
MIGHDRRSAAGVHERGFSRIPICLAVMAATVVGLTTGCSGVSGTSSEQPLMPAAAVISPYQAADGELLWAVVPLTNETGTSVADTPGLSDALVRRVEAVRGLRCLPLNRTIEAMRALGLGDRIGSPQEAELLAKTLGVDGVVAGTVTAWDPYDPPKIGVAVALFAAPGKLKRGFDGLDAGALSRAYTDFGTYDGSNFAFDPASAVSELLDAGSHETLMRVRSYAEGRTGAERPHGWRIHVVSMELYTEFAAERMVQKLIDAEWIRLSREERVASGG